MAHRSFAMRIGHLLLPLLLLVSPTLATFNASDLRGPFIRRYGLSTCPDSLYFSPGPSSSPLASAQDVKAENFYANDQQCTEGAVTVTSSPPSSAATLANYLYFTRGVGNLYAVSVTRKLVCPEVTSFNTGAHFTLAKADDDVAVTWAAIFGSNETVLEVATNSPTYTFRRDVAHIVLNSVCLYTTISPEEIEERIQSDQLCFSKHAKVYISDRREKHVPIQALKLNDHVLHESHGRTKMPDRNAANARKKVNQIILWSHYNPHRVSIFLQFRLRNAMTLTISHNHYLFLHDGEMTLAKNVGSGMRLMILPELLTSEGDNTVVSVESVWRIGLYNPQTTSGNIVVNGFVCSTYTKALPFNTAHSLLAPLRFLFFALDVITSYF